MAWTVKIGATAGKQISRLDRPIQRQIVAYLRERVATDADPRRFGKALHGDRAELWRYRIGDYRLICQIKDDVGIVLVLAVGHRREVYRSR